MADQQQVCPSCGHFNRSGARFCSACGHVFAVTPPAKPDGGAVTPVAPALSPPVKKTPASEPVAMAPAVGSAAAESPVGRDSVAPPHVNPVPQAEPAPLPARGAPSWLWLLLGVLVGILLGAGGVLAAPGFVGLARIGSPEVTATPVLQPTEPATVAPVTVPEQATPTAAPTESPTQPPPETPAEPAAEAPSQENLAPAETTPVGTMPLETATEVEVVVDAPPSDAAADGAREATETAVFTATTTILDPIAPDALATSTPVTP